MEMSGMKNSESEKKGSNESKKMDVSSVENGDDNSGNVLDETFLKMGRWTRFQIILQINSMFLTLTTSFLLVLSFFTGYDPGWKCRYKNSTEFCRNHFNETFSINSQHFYQRCEFNRDDWDFITPKSTSFITQFDLVCDKRWIAALVSSSYYIGGLFGSIISGNIADTFGRKPVLILSLLALTGSSVGGSFATNVWQLIGLNLFAGAACLGCYFTAYIYQLEFISSECRALTITLFQCSAVGSFLLIDGIGYYERLWRPLKLYSSLPCLLSLAILVWTPESPRWLMSVGRISEARSALNTICKFNKNFVDLEGLKITKLTKTTYSYLDILRNCKLLLFTLKIACIWITLAIVAYTLLMGSHHRGGNRYVEFATTLVADTISILISPYLSNKLGRKKSVLGGMLVTGVLLGCMAFVPPSKSWAYQVTIVIAFIARIFLIVSFVVIYTWSFELFATPLRSQGISICSVFKTTGMILVPFIASILQSVSRLLPIIIMSALAITTALMGLSLPETNNKPTRDQFEDFFNIETECTSNRTGIENLGEDQSLEGV